MPNEDIFKKEVGTGIFDGNTKMIESVQFSTKMENPLKSNVSYNFMTKCQTLFKGLQIVIQIVR